MKFRELNIKRPPMFGEHRVRLFQKLFVVKHACAQRLRVFSDPLRVEFANLFRQVLRITGRRRDGQRRILRVNIDGRYVQLKTRMRLLEIKPANTFDVSNHRHELKFNRNPPAPLAFFQNKLLVLQANPPPPSSGLTSTVNGSVAGGEFLRNVLSGPIRLVATRLFFTSTCTISPPSMA